MSTVKPKGRVRSLLLATATMTAMSAFAVPVFHPGIVQAEIAHDQSLVGPDGSFAELVRRDKPSIVTVTTRMPAPARMQMRGMPGNGQSPYDQFFRQFFGQNGPQGGPVPGMPGGPQGPDGAGPDAQALGSGFIMGADGVIVTNNHVVDGATKISVTLDDGREFPATVLGTDPRTDIAVLKIDATGLPALQWGDSNHAEVGDKVIAIGNPFGVGTTVTAGIISARGRDLHNGPYDDFLQVDAAINHGNSGGALLSTDGKVVGITSAIYSPNDGNVGVGFAIPASLAQHIVASLENGGSIERGYLGIRIQSVDDAMAQALGLDTKGGALVAEVTDGTPAADAGLKVGDVVLAVDGKDVADARALTRTVADLKPGSDTTLTLWRDGKKTEASVKLGTLPGQDQMASAEQPGKSPQAGPNVPELGLGLTALTDQDRQQLGLSDGQSGVLVNSVASNSAAADQGISAGDVILSAGTTPVARPDDVMAAVKSAQDQGRKAVMLLVAHQGDQRFVALPVKTS